MYDTATCILWNVCAAHVERGNRKYHVVVEQGKEIHQKSDASAELVFCLLNLLPFEAAVVDFVNRDLL